MGYLPSNYVKSAYPTAYRDATYDPQADNTTEYNVTTAVKIIGNRNYVVFYDNSVQSGDEIALKVSIEGYIFELTKDGVTALKTVAGSNDIYFYIRFLDALDYRNAQLLPADGSETAAVLLDSEQSGQDIPLSGGVTTYFSGLGWQTSSSGLGNIPHLHVFDANGNVPTTSFGVLDTSKIIDVVGDSEKTLAERITTADLDVNGTADISGVTSITNNTQSDSTSTGALKVTGGVGIGKKLNVAGATSIGDNLLVSGNTSIAGTLTVGTSSTRKNTTLNGELILNGKETVKGISGQPSIELVNKNNTNKTTIVSSEVDADRTITLPNKTGTVALRGDTSSNPSAAVNVATHNHTHTSSGTAAASSSTVNAYTGLTKRYFKPSFTGTQGTTSATSDVVTVATGVKASSTADVYNNSSTSTFLTGITSSTGNAAPSEHTHNVAVSGDVNLNVQDTSATGYTAFVASGSTATVLDDVATSSSTINHGVSTGTGTFVTGLNTGTGLLYTSFNDGILVLTTGNVATSANMGPAVTSVTTAASTSVLTGITKSTTSVIGGLTTKYCKPSFSQTVTSGSNSGTAVAAITGISTSSGNAVTSFSTTKVVTGVAVDGTASVAKNTHTHTITPAGSISLGSSSTSSEGSVEYISGGTTSSVSSGGHTHSVETTSSTPSSTVTVATSYHTHTL